MSNLLGSLDSAVVAGLIAGTAVAPDLRTAAGIPVGTWVTTGTQMMGTTTVHRTETGTPQANCAPSQQYPCDPKKTLDSCADLSRSFWDHPV